MCTDVLAEQQQQCLQQTTGKGPCLRLSYYVRLTTVLAAALLCPLQYGQITDSCSDAAPMPVCTQILNKSVGWVSLWGMVYTYLPGVLVCYWQLASRRPAVRLPHWLKAWMDGRKQLGLLSLATSEYYF